MFRWRTGLESTVRNGRLFYGTIALATLFGRLLSFSSINPIKMLFWSVVINGVVAVPLMAGIMYLATRRKVMGKFSVPPALKWLGWLATVVMAAAGIITFATWRR